MRAARPSAPTISALSFAFLLQVLPTRCIGLFTVPTLLEDCNRQPRPSNSHCLANSHCGHKSLLPKQALTGCFAAVLITFCSLDKDRLALPIFDDRLLCLIYITRSSTISQSFHIVSCFKRKLSSVCFLICNEASF